MDDGETIAEFMVPGAISSAIATEKSENDG
jgi:hypothetical protein